MSKTILITGGCGFIGHHFVEHILKNTDWSIVLIDKLSYASSGFNRLRDINVYDSKRIKILTHDLTKPITECLLDEIGQVNYIIHMAASTHVDNCIINPRQAVYDNVLGTLEILEVARLLKQNCSYLELLIYFSTDEVFGPIEYPNSFSEWDRYNSGNPYSASKAGGEELCLAYANTYKLPIFISHTMNSFGERQHPEKFIPKIIKAILNNQKVIIHTNKTKTSIGSRFWIHARNVSDGVLYLINDILPKYTNTTNDILIDKFNIVGEKECNNLEIATFVANIIGKPLNYELVDGQTSRPGHDLRYALNGSKMKNLGWVLKKDFEESLTNTVLWYLQKDNMKWLFL